MNFNYENKRISGILTVLPQNEVAFEDEAENYNFSVKQSMKLKKIMGYEKHRIVVGDTSVSDLCVFGMRHLLDEGLINGDDIDALILVTQTPDYYMPPTSNVIQGELGLKQDMLCLDINQGCAGYLVGLIQAFNLLEQDSIKKVALLNADVLSRRTSKRDRGSYPLIGDAASVTIVERTDDNNRIHANLKMDGSGYKDLIIPAGGMRLPSTSETGVMEVDEAGNFRSLDHLKMNGEAVFNFVQTEVPPLVEDLLAVAETSKEDIDYFMFHQPNRFMLEKLADKMGVAREKLPNNVVENFGNSSSVTIPVNMAFNLGEKLLTDSYKVCLSGFGVGLSCSAMLMDIGKLDFCRMIDY